MRFPLANRYQFLCSMVITILLKEYEQAFSQAKIRVVLDYTETG